MMKQHLRPMEWTEGEEFRFGPFRLIPRERRLEREGRLVRIGDRALDILLCLIANAPDVVTKVGLMEQVWPNLIVEAVNIRFQIAALRRALEDGADGNNYVNTVHGRGYVFVARVSRSLGFDQRCDVMHPGGSNPLPAFGKAPVVAAGADVPLVPLESTIRFVELGVLADTVLDPATLASVLGLTDQSAIPYESLVRLLRDKRILVILDCGEHEITVATRLADT